MSEQKIKMYCIFAEESVAKMNGIRGKLASMSGHAYLHAFFDSAENFPEQAKAYKDSDHSYKITLIVPTTNDIDELYEKYKNICGTSMVIDAGYTVFKNEDGSPRPTKVCLGIGPLPDDLKEDDLNKIKTFT